MNKFLLAAQGYVSCFGWMFQALWKALLENCPDVAFWKKHENFDDHIWYAERVNGRIAMLALTITLILELVSNRSIWTLINVN